MAKSYFRHLIFVTLVASIGIFSACKKQDRKLLSIGPSEGEVSIIAWPGYIERGESDKNIDWVTEFEKTSGCKVVVRTAATSDEMVALMIEGGYDLVTASGDASLRLINSELVSEVNIDLIPSWKSVDQRLQNASWHTLDGKHYGIPYQWGPNVLLYNKNIFKTPPTSWSVVFEEQNLPDGKTNKGRVQAFDGPIYIADAALYLKYVKPELGINDPYELDEKQYSAAIDLLKKQRQLVPKYWHDAMVQVDDFKKEGLVASSTWPFQVNLLIGQKQPVASTIPREGATGWADTTMIHRNSKHVNCAYKWMEHSLSPKLQGDLASWFGAVPAVPSACTNNELLTDSGCETNGFTNFEKISFWRTPVEHCAGGRKCIPYKKWAEDYIAIIGSK
jgi:putative spermidine/putrescine transport system substrate-binding protein